jgi:PAS domain S-box-containing protein
MSSDRSEANVPFDADILIVDDDPAVAQLLVDILGSAGYKVRPASDGALALRSVKAEPPALILLDIKLPTMSGLELCRLLKADPATRPIPVIFVSALHDDREKGMAFQEGAVDYIVKPIHKEELLARVKTHLAIVGSARELAQERDRAQKFLDIAGVMIVALDANAKVTLINRKGRELLGYEQAEILGQRWFEHYIPARNRVMVEEVFLRLMAGSQGMDDYVEGPVLTRRGEERLIAWHTTVVRDTKGGIVGTLSSGMDITERVAAENRLRESEEMFRTTLYSIGDAVITTDTHGRVQVMNAVAESLTGWTDAEARGKPVAEIFRIVNEQTRTPVENPVAEVLRKGAVVGLGNHTLLLARHGAERPIADSAAPIRAPSGAATGVVLVFRDQTEERRTEAALVDAELTFRTFFDNAPIGKSMTAPDGRLLRVNPTFCALVGYTPDELHSLSWASITHPDDLAQTHEGVRSLLDGERDTWATEKRYLTKDGRTVWTAVTTRLQRNSEGHPLHFLTHILDITERKRLQADLAQADRLASMGMLAAGVAHEINNPLAYVLYNVESLGQDLPKVAAAANRCSAALRELVGDAAFARIVGDGADLLRPALLEDAVDRAEEALSGTHRIRDIARGLGTFSRVERVECSRIDLRHAIESAISMAFNEIKYRAQLVKDFGSVPAIWASEGKVAQIFLNLLLNAAHSIDEGNVDGNRIAIRTYAEGGDVLVEVSDTGRGIPPESLARIFEPFFTTEALGRGSGLGLAICRNVVTELGGDIRVESELGHGTRPAARDPERGGGDGGRRGHAAAPSLEHPWADPAGGRRAGASSDDEAAAGPGPRSGRRSLGQGRPGHPGERHGLRPHPVRPHDAGDDRHGSPRVAGRAQPRSRRPDGVRYRRRLHAPGL